MEDIATIPKNIVDIDKLTTLLEGSTKNDHLNLIKGFGAKHTSPIAR